LVIKGSLECLLFHRTAENPSCIALTPNHRPGGASAAVEPVAAWVSSGPEAGAPKEGLDVWKSAPHRFLHLPKGSAEGTDDSVSESQSRTAGMVMPAAEHSHWAAAASV